tara:strand:- start:59 stop:265 length:207 start_codon:yes stop_codon:yes gene_type:complete
MSWSENKIFVDLVSASTIHHIQDNAARACIIQAHGTGVWPHQWQRASLEENQMAQALQELQRWFRREM